MKIKKTEYGVELIPESSFEVECLKHLRNQTSIFMKFEDEWDQKGNLKIEGKPHPWNM